MSLTFGTDGVRGVANGELTPEFVLALGRAAARVLGSDRWLVGRDTRRSGPLLAAALAAGLAAEGATVVDVGVLPTPGVAALCGDDEVPGAVVSASHNPYPDNGIKFFAAGGRKLSDEIEASLEAELRAVLDGSHDREPKIAGQVGTIDRGETASGRYAARIVDALEGRRLDGLTVVVDCANGAASGLAGEVFRAAGADVTVIHAQPDGTNINHGCGSTHPEALQDAVRERGADLGLALDGDADRVLAVDGAGNLIDGDHLIALLARDLHDRGRLAGDTVVVTVMSNLGLRLAMAEAGLNVVETKVGDRYVLEAIEAGGYSLGGEQSGHVILRDLATTGDGILTGLVLADLLVRRAAPLEALAAGIMTRLPQVLKNVPVADRDGLAAAAEVWAEVDAVERSLGEKGRVLLRPSGTEPIIRVMVEAETIEQAEAAVDRLAAAVDRTLGTHT